MPIGVSTRSRYHFPGRAWRDHPKIQLEPIMPFESYKNSRILVTGGAGFIGSHICERLLDAGAEVVSADNYFTGSRRNISHLI